MPSPIVRRDVQLRLGGGMQGGEYRGVPSQAANQLTQLPAEVTPPRRRRRAGSTSMRLNTVDAEAGRAFTSVRRASEADLETRSLPPPSPTRDELADDLGAYLSDLKGRRDEDGRPVVFFPHNYDDVLSVMSRADLLVEDPFHPPPAAGQPAAALNNPQQAPRLAEPIRSWTHYVLEDGLPGGKGQHGDGKEEEEEAEGSDEILRGLARIRQLDLQLQAKAREERCLRLQAAGEVEALRNDLSMLVQSMHWDSIPRKAFFTEHRTPSQPSTSRGDDEDASSPLPTSRTTMSDVVNGRTTFLTDGARDAGGAPRSARIAEEGPYSGSSSPRSVGLSSSGRSSKPSSQTTTTQRRSARAAAGGRDFIRQNIELSKAAFRSHLTREDECRYRALLQGEDDEAADPDGSSCSLLELGPETEDGLAAAAALAPPPTPSLGGERSPTPSSSATHASGWRSPSAQALPRDYGMSDFERERLRQIDAELVQHYPSTASLSTAAEEEALPEGRSVWDDALDSMGAGAATSTFRAYLKDERERRQAELRLLQIDAMLDEYHKIAPLPSAPPSMSGASSSRLPSCRDGLASSSPRPQSAATSEASGSIAIHSARSVRRDVTKHDIQVLVSETKRVLGCEDARPDDRERVLELLRQLKAMGVSREEGLVLDSDSLLKRVSLNIERSRQSLSSQADRGDKACWAAASTPPRHTTTRACGASPPLSSTDPAVEADDLEYDSSADSISHAGAQVDAGDEFVGLSGEVGLAQDLPALATAAEESVAF